MVKAYSYFYGSSIPKSYISVENERLMKSSFKYILIFLGNNNANRPL